MVPLDPVVRKCRQYCDIMRGCLAAYKRLVATTIWKGGVGGSLLQACHDRPAPSIQVKALRLSKSCMPSAASPQAARCNPYQYPPVEVSGQVGQFYSAFMVGCGSDALGTIPSFVIDSSCPATLSFVSCPSRSVKSEFCALYVWSDVVKSRHTLDKKVVVLHHGCQRTG